MYKSEYKVELKNPAFATIIIKYSCSRQAV